MDDESLIKEKEEYLRRLQEATDEYFSATYEGTIYFLSKKHNVNYRTLYDRVKGHSNPPGTRNNRFVLSENDEFFIATVLTFMAENETPMNQKRTRTLAGLLNDKGRRLSDNWMKMFLKRFPAFETINGKPIDTPLVKENTKNPISRFFNTFFFHVTGLDIEDDRIFSIDEAGFKVEHETDRAKVVMPGRAHHIKSYDSSELVTILEVISKSGTVGKPLFICKGDDADLMLGWLSKESDTDINFAKTPGDFIKAEIFLDWIDSNFGEFDDDKWSVLLMDGHFFQISDAVMARLYRYNVIPIFFPSNMTNILQPLDRKYFGAAKLLIRQQIAEGSQVSSICPRKRQFIEKYMEIRPKAYSPKTVIKGFKRCGLNSDTPQKALDEYNLALNKTLRDNASFEKIVVVEEDLTKAPKRKSSSEPRQRSLTTTTNKKTKKGTESGSEFEIQHELLKAELLKAKQIIKEQNRLIKELQAITVNFDSHHAL